MELRSPHLNDTDDIEFILQQESRSEFSNFILRWSREEHTQSLSNPDRQYFMISSGTEKHLGYAILSGLTNIHHNVNLTRLVIAQPGLGYGKEALRLILQKIFEESATHRFWLDVFEDNLRARHTYERVGFQEEGTLREAVKRDNGYASLVIMSLLRPEYEAMKR
jgi:diamine N-acetyltransferase